MPLSWGCSSGAAASAGFEPSQPAPGAASASSRGADACCPSRTWSTWSLEAARPPDLLPYKLPSSRALPCSIDPCGSMRGGAAFTELPCWLATTLTALRPWLHADTGLEGDGACTPAPASSSPPPLLVSCRSADCMPAEVRPVDHSEAPGFKPFAGPRMAPVRPCERPVPCAPSRPRPAPACLPPP